MAAPRNRRTTFSPFASRKPADLGFRMPAEWEPHEATWIAWPHNPEDWPGKFAPVPFLYCEIVRHLARSERVHIVVRDTAAERRARTLLRRAGADTDAVEFFHATTDRSWIRDFGPIFVVQNENPGARLAMTNWRFNAWAKYDDWKHDDAVPDQLASDLKVPVFHAVRPDNGRPAVLEGGSIDVNGRGVMLTTEECLLGEVQQRNPGLDRAGVESLFADYLGIRRTVWLRNGIVGDDTHGHVDDLARFTAHDTIVIVSEKNRHDANFEPLRENLALLKAARNLSGRPFRVVTLPMPEPVVYDGQRLPASYANFYIANSCVLVPTFNDPHDREALNTLQRLFPTRRVVGIACTDLVWGLGTLHCMTQQQPVAP